MIRLQNSLKEIHFYISQLIFPTLSSTTTIIPSELSFSNFHAWVLSTLDKSLIALYV